MTPHIFYNVEWFWLKVRWVSYIIRMIWMNVFNTSHHKKRNEVKLKSFIASVNMMPSCQERTHSTCLFTCQKCTIAVLNWKQHQILHKKRELHCTSRLMWITHRLNNNIIMLIIILSLQNNLLTSQLSAHVTVVGFCCRTFHRLFHVPVVHAETMSYLFSLALVSEEGCTDDMHMHKSGMNHRPLFRCPRKKGGILDRTEMLSSHHDEVTIEWQ